MLRKSGLLVPMIRKVPSFFDCEKFIVLRNSRVDGALVVII